MTTQTQHPPIEEGKTLVVVRNDGSFEVHTCFLGEWKLEPTCSGRWLAAGAPEGNPEEEIYITDDSYFCASAKASERAGGMAGIFDAMKKQLARRADGKFHCPHCGKGYSYLGNFRSHFHGTACADPGANAYVCHHGGFEVENGGSKASWPGRDKVRMAVERARSFIKTQARRAGVDEEELVMLIKWSD